MQAVGERAALPAERCDDPDVAGRHDRGRAEDQHEDRQAARDDRDPQRPAPAGRILDAARTSTAITVTITSSIATNT